MNRHRVLGATGWCSIALGLAIAGSVRAQEFDQFVDLTGIIEDNVIAAGELITAAGQLRGDLIAAGRSIELRDDNAIAGDLLGAGQAVTVGGVVDGDVRIVGRATVVDAAVGGDVMAAGQEVTLREAARIGGRVWLAGESVTLAGDVGRDVRIAAREVAISGASAGDVTVWAEDIRLDATARIAGDFTYRSLNEADIDPGAQILGDVTFIRTERPRRLVGSAMAAVGGFGLVMISGLFVLGLAQVLIAPGFMIGAARALGASTLKSFALGTAAFLLAPFIIFLLAVSIIGLPFLFVSLAAFFVALATAYFVLALAVGGRVLRLFGGGTGSTAGGRIGMLALGMLILFLVAWVPLLGILIGLFGLLVGLGAVMIESYRRGARADPA